MVSCVGVGMGNTVGAGRTFPVGPGGGTTPGMMGVGVGKT